MASSRLDVKQMDLVRALMREFISFGRWSVALMVFLVAFVLGLEGAGLMLLAPLLEISGVSGGSHVNANSPFGSIFSTFGFTASLQVVLCIYLVLIVIHSIFHWHLSILTSKLMLGFIDRLRQRLFDSIGATEWDFMARTHSAEFSHVLTVDIYRVQVALSSLVQILTVIIMLLVYSATAFFLSPVLTLMTAGVGATLLLFLRKHHRHSHKLGEDLTASTLRVHEDIGEYLAGLKLAKSGNVEARLSLRFSRNMQTARESSVAFARRYALSRGLFRLGGAIALCASVYIALVIVMIPIATVLALAFIFTRLFPYLSQLQQAYEQLIYAIPAYKSYAVLCDRCEQAVEPVVAAHLYEFSKEILFNRVSYRSLEGADIINDLNLSIPVFSTTALVGPSGAGKSTIADLLAGLLAPGDGHITIDGRELSDRRSWRDLVAYVPQETFLFNMTVRQNLLWITPEASDESLWEALDHAAAADFVRALPMGLDTVLGERGIRLSGGERQRLAIARALLRKPLLLVLDEATSALDQDNELHIQRTLSKLHRKLTIFLIAHRPATILCADRVMSLQNGRLVKSELRSALQADSIIFN